MIKMNQRFVAEYDRLLARASGVSDGPESLATFWPMVGDGYDHELMVIGRAVNGWLVEADVQRLADPNERHRVLEATRQASEQSGGCPLRWVTDAWGRPAGSYSTARSSFWRFIRGTLAAVDPASAMDPLWSSRITWSNLAKLAPAAGGNPAGELLHVERELGPKLLAEEIRVLQPRRVLLLTGAWWFEPFARHLGLELNPGRGFVEGSATTADTTWVVAPHPQGRPRSMLSDVIGAFS